MDRKKTRRKRERRTPMQKLNMVDADAPALSAA